MMRRATGIPALGDLYLAPHPTTRSLASESSLHLLERVKRFQDESRSLTAHETAQEASSHLPDTQEYRRQTHLHVGVFHNTPQILQDTNPRRGSTVESSERVGREDNLVIVLDEEVEHV